MPPVKHLIQYYKRGRSAKARYTRIAFRVSKSELAALEAKAKADGERLSVWARKRLGVE